MEQTHTFKWPIEYYSSILQLNEEIQQWITNDKEILNKEEILKAISHYNYYLVLYHHIQSSLYLLKEEMSTPILNHLEEYQNTEEDCLETITFWINEDYPSYPITIHQLKEFYILNDYEFIQDQYGKVILLPFFIIYYEWKFHIQKWNKSIDPSPKLTDKTTYQNILDKYYTVIELFEDKIKVDIDNLNHFNKRLMLTSKEIHNIRAIDYFYTLFSQ